MGSETKNADGYTFAELTRRKLRLRRSKLRTILTGRFITHAAMPEGISQKQRRRVAGEITDAQTLNKGKKP